MRRIRAVFVTAQIATALVLIASAVLLIRTFAAIRGVDPGFNSNDVVTARVTLAAAKYPNRTGVPMFFDQLLSRLEAVPGVQAVGAANSPPLSRRANQINVEGVRRRCFPACPRRRDRDDTGVRQGRRADSAARARLHP